MLLQHRYIRVDRRTGACPKQDVRYPKPGIKEISDGESALHQYWRISQLKIPEYKMDILQSSVFSGMPVAWCENFLACVLLGGSESGEEATAELGKNKVHKLQVHLFYTFPIRPLGIMNYCLLWI